MKRVVYKVLPDGSLFFLAAFAVSELPDFPSDWPQEIAEWYESQGVKVKILTSRKPRDKQASYLANNMPLNIS